MCERKKNRQDVFSKQLHSRRLQRNKSGWVRRDCANFGSQKLFTALCSPDCFKALNLLYPRLRKSNPLRQHFVLHKFWTRTSLQDHAVFNQCLHACSSHFYLDLPFSIFRFSFSIFHLFYVFSGNGKLKKIWTEKAKFISRFQINLSILHIRFNWRYIKFK